MTRLFSALFTSALIALTMGTAAIAQQSVASHSEYRLSVNAEELSILGKALDDLPYKVASPLINKLQRQITAQQQKPPETPQPKAPSERTPE